VAVAAGDQATAEEAFGLALASARTLGFATVTAPVPADYGRWLTDSGRPEDGAALLGEARALFERMGSAAWLTRLEAAEATSTTPAPASPT